MRPIEFTVAHCRGPDETHVEVDDVVEAFHDDDAMLGDEFAVAGFLQAAGWLDEEFDAAMEAFGKRCLAGGSFLQRTVAGIPFLSVRTVRRVRPMQGLCPARRARGLRMLPRSDQPRLSPPPSLGR